MNRPASPCASRFQLRPGEARRPCAHGGLCWRPRAATRRHFRRQGVSTPRKAAPDASPASLPPALPARPLYRNAPPVAPVSEAIP